MIRCPVCLQEYDDDTEQCNSCGFKFSGSTTSFKPIKANDTVDGKNTASIDNKQNGELCLRIIKGPQGELVLPLNKERMTVGRSPDSDIFLNDRTVSRFHALITVNDEEILIADRNSFNGVWVNNKNVATARLNEGDLLQIGIFFLRVEK